MNVQETHPQMDGSCFVVKIFSMQTFNFSQAAKLIFRRLSPQYREFDSNRSILIEFNPDDRTFLGQKG